MLQSPELKSFLKQLRSPGHLTFLVSNFAVLVQLHYFTTARKRERTEEFIQQMDDLEYHVEVMKDLEAEEQEVREQIALLKQRKSQLAKESANRSTHSSQNSKSSTHMQGTTNERRGYAEQFLNHRKVYSTTFTNSQNISKLFPNSDVPSWATLSKQSERSDFSKGEAVTNTGLTYYSKIQNSIMALSNLLINSFLVELNLRGTLQEQEADLHNINENFLVEKKLFHYMKDDEDKQELLARLHELKDSASDLAHGNSLPRESVNQLMQNLGLSEASRSIETSRANFQLYKSGRYLNYEHSDTFKFIQGLQPVRFQSNIVNNEEYISSFKGIFQAYEKETGPLKNITLILRIAKALANGGLFTPSFTVFKYLLDNLGNVGLYNYQSLVYDTLPAYEHRQTVLADSETRSTAPRKWYHFSHLIENDPSFLKSLLNYQIPRKDNDTFNQLLGFFEPFNPTSIISKDYLPLGTKAESSSVQTKFQQREPVLVDLDTVGAAIKGCVELGEFQMIDMLISKLILNLIQTPDGVKVALNHITDESTLISRNFSPMETGALVFTEDILVLLLQAYTETKATAKMNWTLEHAVNFTKLRDSDSISAFIKPSPKSPLTVESSKAREAATKETERSRKRTRPVNIDMANNSIFGSDAHMRLVAPIA